MNLSIHENIFCACSDKNKFHDTVSNLFCKLNKMKTTFYFFLLNVTSVKNFYFKHETFQYNNYKLYRLTLLSLQKRPASDSTMNDKRR